MSSTRFACESLKVTLSRPASCPWQRWLEQLENDIVFCFKSCLFRPVVQCAPSARNASYRCHFLKTVCSDLLFNALCERKNAFKCCHPESQFLSLLSKLLPICCHFYNLCISFYNLWDTFFDILLRIDSYLHLLIRFALFLDMCPLICEDALLEITVCSMLSPECILLIPFLCFVFCVSSFWFRFWISFLKSFFESFS